MTAEKPFALEDFGSDTLVMTEDGVPYVADALAKLNAATVALDDAQASAVVGSCTVVEEMQPAIVALREARHLLKCALKWHVSEQKH